MPVAIKDNLQVEGVETTCASKILKGHVAAYDATVVSRLKAADAVFVGKTNLDEFAMGSSTENSAFQRTTNPWDAARVPGGSSGGSAAAVAARLCLAATASDTGGSIRQTAAVTGIAGPTGGSDTKPVGTVWFAWISPLQLRSECRRFTGDRAQVRQATVQHALTGLLELVPTLSP